LHLDYIPIATPLETIARRRTISQPRCCSDLEIPSPPLLCPTSSTVTACSCRAIWYLGDKDRIAAINLTAGSIDSRRQCNGISFVVRLLSCWVWACDTYCFHVKGWAFITCCSAALTTASLGLPGSPGHDL